jgi:putative hydrolase of the HAD superfamily
MFRALVFDLDDTLYIEEDFVKSGYRAVAQRLDEIGCCASEAAFEVMIETLETQGRQMVFPALLEAQPSISLSIQDLVEIYRQHTPSIELFPGYMELLKQLRRTHKLGIITDGLPEVQKRKVLALGLSGAMDSILFTWEYGSERQKPHPMPFSMMLDYLGVEPRAALYVGDNPEKDCRGAHGIGMWAALVKRPSRSGGRLGVFPQEKPEFLIETLHELPQILRQMN